MLVIRTLPVLDKTEAKAGWLTDMLYLMTLTSYLFHSSPYVICITILVVIELGFYVHIMIYDMIICIHM